MQTKSNQTKTKQQRREKACVMIFFSVVVEESPFIVYDILSTYFISLSHMIIELPHLDLLSNSIFFFHFCSLLAWWFFEILCCSPDSPIFIYGSVDRGLSLSFVRPFSKSYTNWPTQQHTYPTTNNSTISIFIRPIQSLDTLKSTNTHPHHFWPQSTKTSFLHKPPSKLRAFTRLVYHIQTTSDNHLQWQPQQSKIQSSRQSQSLQRRRRQRQRLLPIHNLSQLLTPIKQQILWRVQMGTQTKVRSSRSSTSKSQMPKPCLYHRHWITIIKCCLGISVM